MLGGKFSLLFKSKKECNLLAETLNYNLEIALGSNSEKARSELIIAPILVDLRRLHKTQLTTKE